MKKQQEVVKFKLTNKNFEIIVKDFKKYAKSENIEVSFNCGDIIVYCSELEMFRIAHKYRFCKSVRYGYSENLKTYYFILNLPSFY